MEGAPAASKAGSESKTRRNKTAWRGKQKTRHKPYGGCVPNADRTHELNAGTHAFVFACAKIEADDGLRGIGNAHDGRCGNLPHRVEYRHHTHINIAAPALQRGVAHHLHRAVGGGHDEARKAQGADLAHQLPAHAHGRRTQAQQRFFAAEKRHGPQRREKL